MNSRLLMGTILMCVCLCGLDYYAQLKNEEGNRFYRKGLLGKAEQAYQHAQKSEPDSGQIAVNLANTYYRESLYDSSRDLY
ncbi:MAG: hypothetical protein WCG06_05695, partial [Candidatus Omnitrophota bacterium]